VVPESAQDVAKDIMEGTFKFHQRGFCAPVKIERSAARSGPWRTLIPE
jgi:hypothetical protein